jgi:hypothetical protein
MLKEKVQSSRIDKITNKIRRQLIGILPAWDMSTTTKTAIKMVRTCKSVTTEQHKSKSLGIKVQR